MLATPRLDRGMIAGSEHLWHCETSVNGRPSILRTLENVSPSEGFCSDRLRISQNPGQQPNQTFDQHHGRQLTARQHVIPNRDLVVDCQLENSLVDPFVGSEERALVEAARQFAREQLLELDRRCDRDEGSICSALPQLAEMGFLALRLPEQYHGLGCTRMVYAAILHELAYASPSAAVTLSVHNMVGKLLLQVTLPKEF